MVRITALAQGQDVRVLYKQQGGVRAKGARDRAPRVSLPVSLKPALRRAILRSTAVFEQALLKVPSGL